MHLVGGRLDELDSVLGFPEPVHGHHHLTKAGDANQRRAPVGDRTEIVDEPPQSLLHLIKGADGHHQCAKGKIAREVSRSCDNDRRDDGEPAVAGRDPGEPSGRGNDLPHDAENVLELASETLIFIFFTAIERHSVDVFVEAHKRETQLGLLRVAFAIQLDQRAADAPTEPGTGASGGEGAPDHVPGNCETVTAQIQWHVSREAPQHPDETAKEERRLQEPDAEIGCQFGQMPGVLVDALVRVGAQLAGIDQTKSAPRFEPYIEQVPHEPFA